MRCPSRSSRAILLLILLTVNLIAASCQPAPSPTSTPGPIAPPPVILTETPIVAPKPTDTLRPTNTPNPIAPPVVLCGPSLGWQLYTVKPGDTLFSIARLTGSTVKHLMLANCLDTDQIKIGQWLFVPFVLTPTPIVPPPAVPCDPCDPYD